MKTKQFVFKTTDTELSKYNGLMVEIVRPLTSAECDIEDVGAMYRARFFDGYERDVFEDELLEKTENKKENSIMFKVGDKVRINVDVVSQNGLFDSVEQEKQYDYIVSHANEVYIIKLTNSSAPANFQLDHPIVGFTSFYKEELIPVTEEEEMKPKSKEEILREQILKIMNSEDSIENYEKVAEAVFSSISSDDESYSNIGYNLLYAVLTGDADGVLEALCGWSMKTILAKAGLIPDDEGVFVGD